VPAYLRYIAALTSGFTAFFVYSFITLGITGALGYDEVPVAAGGLVSIVAGVVAMATAVATSDWIVRRYPPPSRQRPADDEQRRTPG